jgi:predicted small metal-binding protein
MKQLTCSQLTGPCDAVIKGETKDELMKNGMEHVHAAHPEMVDAITHMSKEDGAKWQAEFDKQWDAAPTI